MKHALEVKVTLLLLLAAVSMAIPIAHYLGKDSLSYLRNDGFIENIMEASTGQIVSFAVIGLIALCMAIHAINRDEEGKKIPEWETNHRKLMNKDRIFPH